MTISNFFNRKMQFFNWRVDRCMEVICYHLIVFTLTAERTTAAFACDNLGVILSQTLVEDNQINH